MFRKTFLPPIADLLAFEAAARHTSISRAAEELHLTQSAVSRQIRQLEEQLGTALFHRVRQRVVLTDAGRIYAADVQAVLQQLSASTQRPWRLPAPTACSTWPCCPRWAPAGSFRAWGLHGLHPEAMVNFSARTEPLTLLARRLTRPSTSAHRTGPGRCEYLMHEETVPVCSPIYRDRHNIRTPQDLTRVALLQQSTRPTQWAEWFELAGAPRRWPCVAPVGALRHDCASCGVAPGRSAAAAFSDRAGTGRRQPGGAVRPGAHQHRCVLPWCTPRRARSRLWSRPSGLAGGRVPQP